MVARDAGAAGPVLLACRQWDPLGLARRLPSLGVGAWRCAPLLPWQVQCPVCVCAALAAGSGGSGRYLVLCLSRFPLPAPPVPRCVWRAVPSRCPLPSLAGTPLHAVCAFRALGLFALPVVPVCPFHVCALALPRRPLPPLLGGVACTPRAVPALGAGRAVPPGPCPSACPALVPCTVWRALGGAVGSRFPPTWLGVVGVTTHWLWVRGGAGVGTRHQPQSARSFELALRAVGAARGRPGGGGALAWVWGVRGRALSHPRLPALWAGCRGPLPTGCGCGGVRAWGPVTSPTARALASWLCALWGRHEGARGGASCLGVGRPGSGALPPPTARPLGGLLGPTTHWLWVRGGGGVGTRHQPHSARSFELALHAVGAARGRPGGGASCLGVGRPGSGALPPPTARPLGGLPGPTTHWLWVRGAAGVGTRHKPHSARSCELALRAVGAA